MKNRRINKKKISIIGLGRLGLALAVSFALRGFKTIGVDIKENIVNSINRGMSPIIEPGLQEFISKKNPNLKASLSHEEAINKTDISIVLVATPSDSRGNFSNIYVEKALKSLAKCLKKSRKNYHLFIISSTVMPGSVEEKLIPLIEKYSGRKLNVGFGICYIPDLVALGSVISDFLNPDLVIVGESDNFAGNQIISVYKKLCKNKPQINRMPIISAEISKVVLNNYITIKMSFANALANLCEKIPGADVDLITRTIGVDKRISPYYLKGGLSFGGTCFPRDTRAIKRLSKKYNCQTELIEVVEKINEFQDKHLVDIVLRNLSSVRERKISILGLSFKPNTPVIVESPAVKLIHKLLKKRVEITVYDPLAMNNTRNIFGDKIQYAKSIKDCLSSSSLWVITTPDKKFKNIDNSFVTNNSTVIIDCWRILMPQKFSGKVRYIKWGYHQNNK